MQGATPGDAAAAAGLEEKKTPAAPVAGRRASKSEETTTPFDGQESLRLIETRHCTHVFDENRCCC